MHQKDVPLTPENEANPQASRSLSDQSEMTPPVEDRCDAARVTCPIYCQKVPEVCQRRLVWDETSRRSVAASGRPSFRPSATVPCIENAEDRFDISRAYPLIDSYDPAGIPLKPKLVSFSRLNPCASSRC